MEVTSGDIDGYRRARIENEADETQRQINEVLVDAIPFPEAFPAYRDLMVDSEGNLWVEAYRKPDESRLGGNDEARWTVFDPTGRMLGDMLMPEGLDIYQIGTDFVLGRWTDDLDVQHAVVYELFRDGR